MIRKLLVFLACLGCVLSSACRDSPSAPPSPAAEQDSLTVLLQAGGAGSWPTGLDPATNATGGTNLTIMNAIFGGLFQLTADDDGSRPRILPVLAKDYSFSSDSKSLYITLRDDLKFSDGTALNAEALYSHIARTLSTPCSCAPTRWPWAADKAFSVIDPVTVALHFSRPYPAAIYAIPTSNLNWVASVTALKAMGEEAFRISPVGAGPFMVKSNVLSSRLLLERNPLYWEPDRPLLKNLTFQVASDEQSAYLALVSGNAQVAEAITDVRLTERAMADSRIQVIDQPATSVYFVQLNTTKPPFSNQKARDAIYFATDAKSIAQGVVGSRFAPSQSFTASGGLFHVPVVSGYKNFDLKAARALVDELGGLKAKIAIVADDLPGRIAVALQTQWNAAGIDTEISTSEFAAQLENYRTNSWDISLQRAGSFDPDNGLVRRIRSDQAYSGIRDAEVDRLLSEASLHIEDRHRAESYKALATYMSDKSYGPFLFEFGTAHYVVKGVKGPGLTTRIPPLLVSTGILWQHVDYSLER